MSFKIIHKSQPIVFATDFRSMERANKWISEFNPSRYTDKTLKREDLLIVEDK